MTRSTPTIGTLREGPLHRSLKAWYHEPGDRVEVPVDGFVIDLVRGDLLIEVQTRGFSSMRQKLRSLLDEGHRIRIVHPIATERRIVRIEDDGTMLSSRRSPKRGRPSDIFSELVSFPELMLHPGLEIDLLLTVEEEHRSRATGRAWRRHGWAVRERTLVDVVGSIHLAGTDDLVSLVPEGLPPAFTTADLAGRTPSSLRAAQHMAYCLRRVGAFVEDGKRGNAIVYRLAVER